MKPRRLLSSVDLLPTILEHQESKPRVQLLDDYIDSIRELSQPTYPLSGPMQGFRLSSLRMSKYPTMSLATASTVLTYKPWAVIGPEHVLITLTDSPTCSNQDPLDWLFAQEQHDGVSLPENSQEDLCMM
ncbi:uncharacterized protein si:ch73-6k14.2 [Triplophysa rosa]|uniref:Ribosomal protein S6 kinase beta-2-like n=1 Tax=Triplophysa rosa TaxID=992332 RepID=A0A9W8C997_TRIRA|nr:uncharacterized protein si:ch73-6k14.2 [Triplophysa rosa]KAI7811094.1 putative ribosomal protein S6 kinase beta-2-like [Triplophysa rosa]